MLQACAGKHVCYCIYFFCSFRLTIVYGSARCVFFFFPVSEEVIFWFHSSISSKSWNSGDSLLGCSVCFCVSKDIPMYKEIKQAFGREYAARFYLV